MKIYFISLQDDRYFVIWMLSCFVLFSPFPYYILYFIFHIVLNICMHASWCSMRFLRKNHIPVVKLRGKSNEWNLFGIFWDGHVLYLYQIRWTVTDSCVNRGKRLYLMQSQLSHLMQHIVNGQTVKYRDIPLISDVSFFYSRKKTNKR